VFQDLPVREEVLTDELWARPEPLIPVRPRRFRHPGRKRADDRAALEGILYVVRTGIGWNRLPTALFGASGATCWRRLTERHEAGVRQQLHERLLAELRAAGLRAAGLRAAGLLDLSTTLVDFTHRRALKGGPHTGPSPVDRRKPGSKHHLITDATGIPLAVTLTGGNRNDVTQLIPLIDAIPLIRGVVGTTTSTSPALRRPRLRPRQVPPPGPSPRHHTRHRPTRRRTRLRPRQSPLAGRTHLRLARRLPPTTRPHRTTSRPPPGHPQPRLLDHLPPQTHSELIT
jgi:transposase